MNLDIYQPYIWTISKSIFGSDGDQWVKVSIDDLPKHIPIIKAFLEDNEIQEITICSSNIGFVKRFQKRYKADPHE